ARRDFPGAFQATQEAASDLVVAKRTVFQIPDDPQLVFAADHFLERSDGASVFGCSCLRHDRARVLRPLTLSILSILAKLLMQAPDQHRQRTAAEATRSRQMKQFLIKYRLTNGTPDAWHQDVAKFIAALDGDPDLKGRISYRVMKTKDGADYYHIATPADDNAVKTLQQRDFFKAYTEKTRAVARGDVTVSPLETIAETARA
ncbi:MAG: hypothetical protein WB663_18180, partial [Beijerinckiaceae bacterium]